MPLNRLVALKVILHGAHAGADQLQRFRVEAEAAARLQHPNIVQIFDVGEQAGTPYLALEFVDGGTLAERLDGKPLPPPQAAELVETLARAIHAAHDRGIVHRDLKPANILLTRDGIPKITDFGLARRLDEAGQTQSGAVLGTPSYMAPEQAAGQVRAIGPAADVYALGTMLYELLTGRPPFKGASVLETLEQVRTQEALPPRYLQPKLPRDLETICLKCLEKTPGRRYASAALLADDLCRFIQGEPIQARSYNVLDRLAHTLDRRHLKIEFRAWGNVFLLFAPISLTTHLILFLLLRGGPPYPDLAIALSLGIEFTLMSAIFWHYRARTLLPLSTIEGQLVSIWTAYLLAAGLMMVVGYQTAGPQQPFDVLSLYPLWTILTGLMFVVVGSNYWGPSHVVAMLFFGLALLMPLNLSWAPLEFGLAWCVYFTWAGMQLRRLGEANLDRDVSGPAG